MLNFAFVVYTETKRLCSVLDGLMKCINLRCARVNRTREQKFSFVNGSAILQYNCLARSTQSVLQVPKTYYDGYEYGFRTFLTRKSRENDFFMCTSFRLLPKILFLFVVARSNIQVCARGCSLLLRYVDCKK